MQKMHFLRKKCKIKLYKNGKKWYTALSERGKRKAPKATNHKPHTTMEATAINITRLFELVKQEFNLSPRNRAEREQLMKHCRFQLKSCPALETLEQHMNFIRRFGI